MVSTPVSVRSMASGQMKKDHESLFDFQILWSKQSTITDATMDTTSEEDESDDAEIIIDTSTDLAYHNKKEYVACQTILQALSPDEVQAMPDYFMPLRHYRAEKGDVTKAIEAIKSTLGWRKEFKVDSIVKAFQTQQNRSSMLTINDGKDFQSLLYKENETGKIYTRGFDKDGRAVLYMRPGRENTMDADSNMVHLVYQLEKAIACSLKNGYGKICLVIDYDGFTLAKSPPMSTSRRTLDILQKHYCERMYRAYVCNPPFVFKSFWAVIKPFIDPNTKQKVCFCSGKKGLEQIANDMGGAERAMDHLEECAGGTGNVRTFDSKEFLNLPFNVAFDEKIEK